MKMIAFCDERPKAGRIEAVVCWDADRLSRASSIRTAVVLDSLMSAGVSHLFTSEGWIDLEDEEGDVLVFNVKQSAGRSAYSRDISKAVTRDAIERAGKGLWVAGQPPYGYRVGADGRLEIVEADAAAVRRIFALIIAGRSLGEIVRALNGDGVRPPSLRGVKRPDYVPKWRRDTLHGLLGNRAYVGDLVWNKTHQGKHRRVRQGRSEKTTGQRGEETWERNDEADLIVTANAHPAIVTRETFDAALAQLRSRRWKHTAPAAGGGEWIFSGLLRCDDCKAKMYGRTKRYRRNGTPTPTAATSARPTGGRPSAGRTPSGRRRSWPPCWPSCRRSTPTPAGLSAWPAASRRRPARRPTMPPPRWNGSRPRCRHSTPSCGWSRTT